MARLVRSGSSAFNPSSAIRPTAARGTLGWLAPGVSSKAPAVAFQQERTKRSWAAAGRVGLPPKYFSARRAEEVARRVGAFALASGRKPPPADSSDRR